MPEEAPPQSSSIPRITIFNATFWEVLPSHFTAITTRFTRIANLHSRTHSDVLATDRAGALNSLKAELDMLEHDLVAYRDIVKSIDITDIAGIYMVAGRGPHRALQIAKEDMEDLERSLREVEERIGECRAMAIYGVGEER